MQFKIIPLEDRIVLDASGAAALFAAALGQFDHSEHSNDHDSDNKHHRDSDDDDKHNPNPTPAVANRALPPPPSQTASQFQTDTSSSSTDTQGTITSSTPAVQTSYQDFALSSGNFLNYSNSDDSAFSLSSANNTNVEAATLAASFLNQSVSFGNLSLNHSMSFGPEFFSRF